MAAGFPEVAIRLTGYKSLSLRYRFDHHVCFFKKFIKAAASDRISAAIDYRSRFYITHGRHTSLRGTLNYRREFQRFRFTTENGNQG